MRIYPALIIILLLVSSCSMMSKMGVEGVREKQSIFNVSWVKNLDPVYDTGNLPIQVGSPFVHNGLVFMGDSNGFMKAYDQRDGRIVWEVNDEFSLSSTPFVFKNQLLYGGQNGRFYSRNPLDGKLQWVVDIGSPVESIPVVYKDRIFLHLRDHKLSSLDLKTGKVLWNYKRSIQFATTLQRNAPASPFGNSVVVGFADGYLVSFRVEDGSLLWETKIPTASKFIDIDARAVLAGDRMIITSATGPTAFINPKTGAILRKMEYASTREPLILNDMILIGTTSGEIIRLDARGAFVERFSIGEDAITNLARWKKGVVVSTTGGKVHYLNLENFKVDETFDLGSYASGVLGEFQISKQNLVFCSTRNRLYLIK